MARNYPISFPSFEEFESYQRCLRKARVGDEADVYINDNFPSKLPSGFHTRVAIGGSYYRTDGYNSKVLLLLTNDHSFHFWKTDSEHPWDSISDPEGKKLAKQFKYGYWAYPDDVLIKKLYLKGR